MSARMTLFAVLLFMLPQAMAVETKDCPEVLVRSAYQEQRSARREVIEQRLADEEQLYEQERADRQRRNEEYWKYGADYGLTPKEIRERNRLAEDIFAEEELNLRLLNAQHRQEQRDFDQYQWRLQNSTFEGQYQLQTWAQQYAAWRDYMRYGPYH